MGMTYNLVAIEASVAEQLVADPDDDRIESLLAGGVELGKMWQAAQIVVAGSLDVAEPLLTGTEIGDDLGYGPAHLASPGDVARVHKNLADVTTAELVERFDVATMIAQSAYPMVWDEDPDDLAAEVAGAAASLLEVYRGAAEQGQAILAVIW